jgi:hypothetical protein
MFKRDEAHDAESCEIEEPTPVKSSIINVLEPSRQFCVQSCIRVGDRIQYTCFVPAYVAPSSQPFGGDGLFTAERLPPFTWVGFYPGEVVKSKDAKREVYTMGCEAGYIIADGTVKAGLHKINEAGKDSVANVWYAKLRCGYVLFFVGREVQAREELLTCYSRSYNRGYVTASATHCSDPRCASGGADGVHRLGSAMQEEWKQPLLDRMPPSLKLPPRVRGAELFRYKNL